MFPLISMYAWFWLYNNISCRHFHRIVTLSHTHTHTHTHIHTHIYIYIYNKDLFTADDIETESMPILNTILINNLSQKTGLCKCCILHTRRTFSCFLNRNFISPLKKEIGLHSYKGASTNERLIWRKLTFHSLFISVLVSTVWKKALTPLEHT